MSAVDKIPTTVPTNALPQDRSCGKCWWSWNCPPTTKEIKDGIIDGQMYCCNNKVVQTLNGETFPRLASVAREQERLCGGSGKYWSAIRIIPKQYTDDSFNGRRKFNVGPTTLAEHKNRQERKDATKSHQSKVRKPYTVT